MNAIFGRRDLLRLALAVAASKSRSVYWGTYTEGGGQYGNGASKGIYISRMDPETGRLTAPMPGKVVSFNVKAGDRVSKGQALAVMEAMKMEHTIAAPADGTVEELLYAPGDQVTEGAELLRIAA